MSDRSARISGATRSLVAYLYDDLESGERRSFAAHLKTCPVCRTELDDLVGVRADLAQWKPPDPARVLTFAPVPPPQPSRWSSLGGIPAWAQAAAALLVLGVALAIANLQVRVDDEGVTVSTGWTAQPAAVTPAGASVAATPEQPPAEAPWRADLAALESTLRAELQNAPARAAFAPAASANVDDEAVLRQVRSLIATSESNQRTRAGVPHRRGRARFPGATQRRPAAHSAHLHRPREHDGRRDRETAAVVEQPGVMGIAETVRIEVRVMRTIICSVAIALFAAPLVAQQRPSRPTAQQRDERYPIATMERVLEGAVEHGAKVTRDRMQAVVPAEMLLSDNARVRGYRLEGYGVFFDVAVPMLEGSVTWSFRTLDQNNLGLESALTALRSLVEKSGDANFEQALKRVELQVAPVSLNTPDQTPGIVDARTLTGSALTTTADPPPPSAPPPPADAILDDLGEAFRAEIRDALMNAMLDHGAALRLTSSDLFTIAARGSDDRSMFGPLNDDAQTIMISMKGADLTAYLSGQINRDEARQRMTVRVF